METKLLKHDLRTIRPFVNNRQQGRKKTRWKENVQINSKRCVKNEAWNYRKPFSLQCHHSSELQPQLQVPDARFSENLPRYRKLKHNPHLTKITSGSIKIGSRNTWRLIFMVVVVVASAIDEQIKMNWLILWMGGSWKSLKSRLAIGHWIIWKDKY